jgi:hypothetical protein
MSGLGEWDDDAPVYDLGDAPVADVDDEPDEPIGAPDVTGRVSAVLDGLDVASIAGGLVASMVTSEIHRQVQREVAPIVTEAVAAVLTPERLEALRTAATAAAEAELNPPPAGEPTPPEEAPTLYYGEEGRADYRWSARWWESAEAIARLEAMWRAWEHLRMDASTGTSVWLRDHADHHLGVLMSPTGPWALSKDTAGPDEPLPYEAPPEGLFPDVRDH